MTDGPCCKPMSDECASTANPIEKTNNVYPRDTRNLSFFLQYGIYTLFVFFLQLFCTLPCMADPSQTHGWPMHEYYVPVGDHRQARLTHASPTGDPRVGTINPRVNHGRPMDDTRVVHGRALEARGWPIKDPWTIHGADLQYNNSMSSMIFTLALFLHRLRGRVSGTVDTYLITRPPFRL